MIYMGKDGLGYNLRIQVNYGEKGMKKLGTNICKIYSNIRFIG